MQLNLYNEQIVKSKPFLKWVGGKRQLLPIIEKSLPDKIRKTRKIKKYYEPFIGGGAVLFHLTNQYNVEKSYISDVNSELILAYNVIKNDVSSLIDVLMTMSDEYLVLDDVKRKDYFLDIRSSFNNNLADFDYGIVDDDSVLRVAQLIFMNKTCFNGLFRVNKKGEFNVPHGRYKKPLICDQKNLKNVNTTLKSVEIHNASYLSSENLIDECSFVYLDPPYRPLNKTSSFTSYSTDSFDDNSQIELSQYYKRISDKGAYVMLSNSDPHNVDENDEFFDNLYQDFNIKRVSANRSINSKGDKRGSINELLITNYG